jgi:hypothetical protein
MKADTIVAVLLLNAGFVHALTSDPDLRGKRLIALGAIIAISGVVNILASRHPEFASWFLR